jgi:phospholipid/cholesterol/gamma-HCH transport system ATP-binding protein
MDNANTQNAREEPPVAIKDLHKSFGKQTVLNGINLQVERGETVAVLGRSGTGKSVLLKVVIGLETSDSGSVRVAGQEIGDADVRELNEVRKKMGFLFQHAALYDSLSVEENVAFPLSKHTKMSAGQQKEKVRELLAGLGMERDLEKMPGEISGGMQKRVGLARALALDPEILLFDEPTAGLDPITAAEIGNMILELKAKRKITSVVVTHDIRGAKVFSDRMVIINEGKILAEGTFADLQHSQDQFVTRFMGDGS